MPSIVNCFQCGEKAILQNADDEKHYNESGLCPKCWNEAMEESSKASIEAKYLKENGVRFFSEFPEMATCPVCKTSNPGYCVLLGIDNTSDGSIEEGQPTHLHCALAARYSKEANIIYKALNNRRNNAVFKRRQKNTGTPRR